VGETGWEPSLTVGLLPRYREVVLTSCHVEQSLGSEQSIG